MKPIDCAEMYRDGRHYDAQFRDLVADIPFYLEQIRIYGDPVLELACGTGRITIPIAGEGFEVTGLDVSAAMLSQARSKAAAQGVRVDWVQADCRDFDLDKRFAFIFFPANSLSHLHDRGSLEACFARVRQHLASDGRFLIDVFNPRLDILIRDPAQRYPVSEYPDPDGRGPVTVTENNAYDTASQINRIRWYYEIGEGLEEFVVELNMRIFYPQELDGLLQYNGFAIEVKYGDFDGSPFNSASPKQLVVCRVE